MNTIKQIKHRKQKVQFTSATQATEEANTAVSLPPRSDRTNISKNHSQRRIRRINQSNSQNALEIVCPLPQVNQFQIYPKMRSNFSEFLEGKKTIIELINDCNFQKGTLSKKSKRMSRKSDKSQLDLVLNQSLEGSLLANRKNNNQIKEEFVKKKNLMTKRYDLLRGLVNRNRIKDNQNQLDEKSVLVSKMKQIIEDFSNRLQQKDLVKESTTGVNQIEQIKYMKWCKGGIRQRVNKNENQNQKKTMGEIKLETLNQERKLKQDLYQKADDVIKNIVRSDFIKTQQQDQRTKFQILHNRNISSQLRAHRIKKNNQEPIDFIEQHQAKNYEVSKQPLYKDIKLFQFIHGKIQSQKLNQDLFKEQPDKKIQKTDQKKIDKKSQHHVIVNFRKNSIDDLNQEHSDDTQDVSVLEANLNLLYEQFQQVQSQFLKDDNKISQKISYVSKIDDISKQISDVCQRKLFPPRKLMNL